MSEIEVVGLNYYPIKSCGAVAAEEVALSEFGIEHDREWMLVGTRGQFLSQRAHPELALVQTSIEDGLLSVVAPGVGALAVPLERDPHAEIVPVDLWKKPGAGTNEGVDANGYFSDYLGKDARLLRLQQPRNIKPEYQVANASARTGFADGFPLLLASTNSLSELNKHVENPVSIDRFRPNIVVKGAAGYDEDYWREVQVGSLRAFVVRACARCPVPNIDQQVGALSKERPVTDALRATRHGVDSFGEKGDFFGQNMVHVFEPGTNIRLHDTVTVVTRNNDRNFQQA